MFKKLFRLPRESSQKEVQCDSKKDGEAEAEQSKFRHHLQKVSENLFILSLKDFKLPEFFIFRLFQFQSYRFHMLYKAMPSYELPF